MKHLFRKPTTEREREKTNSIFLAAKKNK